MHDNNDSDASPYRYLGQILHRGRALALDAARSTSVMLQFQPDGCGVNWNGRVSDLGLVAPFHVAIPSPVRRFPSVHSTAPLTFNEAGEP
jgi:hypothetical protein